MLGLPDEINPHKKVMTELALVLTVFDHSKRVQSSGPAFYGTITAAGREYHFGTEK